MKIRIPVRNNYTKVSYKYILYAKFFTNNKIKQKLAIVSMEIKMNRTFTKDLQDKNSESFINLSNELKSTITNNMKNSGKDELTKIAKVDSINFKEGSIISNFEIVFESNDKVENNIRTQDVENVFGKILKLSSNKLNLELYKVLTIIYKKIIGSSEEIVTIKPTIKNTVHTTNYPSTKSTSKNNPTSSPNNPGKTSIKHTEQTKNKFSSPIISMVDFLLRIVKQR